MGIIFCSKSKELDFKEPLIVIDFLLSIRSLQQHVEVQGENERKDCARGSVDLILSSPLYSISLPLFLTHTSFLFIRRRGNMKLCYRYPASPQPYHSKFSFFRKDT